MKQTVSLEQFKGQSARVKLIHQIYGIDVMNIGSFQPLVAENKIGFIFQGREIFLYNHEVEEIEIRNYLYIITGKLFTIQLQFV